MFADVFCAFAPVTRLCVKAPGGNSDKAGLRSDISSMELFWRELCSVCRFRNAVLTSYVCQLRLSSMEDADAVRKSLHASSRSPGSKGSSAFGSFGADAQDSDTLAGRFRPHLFQDREPPSVTVWEFSDTSPFRSIANES